MTAQVPRDASAGVSWPEFELAAADLAVHGRELFRRFGFVFIGTIRADGTPRISPVEVHIVTGHLMLVMITGTQKVRDVHRDPRVTLQTPVMDPAEPGDELKLSGRVAIESDSRQRTATADVIESTSGWRPGESWSFFHLRVTAVAHISWERGDMLLTRWSMSRGLRATERRRLDPEAVLYRKA